MSDKIYKRSFRLRKAYGTTLVVLSSYISVGLRSKIMGRAWYERQMLTLHLRNAERVRDAILELKGLFIKLGQMLSILSNFLPEAFQRPLEALQDQVTPQPFERVRERILQELGKPIEALYAWFDEKPLAAASIGQVHRARLHDGTAVVVKVQHLDIETIAQIDLEIICNLTKFIAFFFDIKGLDFLYSQVRKMIEEELDFLQEARAMQKISLNLANFDNLRIPHLHQTLSTQKVMTSDWHDGVKISNLTQLEAWGISRRELAGTLLKAYCKMLFEDGFYHADPHPGNILVQSDGKMILLDFGAVATLHPKLREGIPQLIEAALHNDNAAMVAALHQMGFLSKNAEAQKMADKMLNALREFLQNEVKLEGLDFKNIEIHPFDNSLFRLVQEIGFSGIAGTVQVPRDYVLLNRMIALLLGLCHTLDPTLNPLEVIRPYAKAFLMREQKGILSFLRGALQRNLVTALGLPDELHQVLQKIKAGQIEWAQPDLRPSAQLIYKGIQQLIYTILFVTCLAFAYILQRDGVKDMTKICYWMAGILGYLLVRSGRKN